MKQDGKGSAPRDRATPHDIAIHSDDCFGAVLD